MIEQNVHRIDHYPRGDGKLEKELVISNLRWFHVKVAIVNSVDHIIEGQTLHLKATLLYENGHTVLILPVVEFTGHELHLVMKGTMGMRAENQLP